MSRDSVPTIRILIIGPSNVGKSALLQRYCDDDFDPNNATATIGLDFREKRLSVHGKVYRAVLLDTAGQERFRTLSTSFYRGAQGILFVYDVNNRATFDRMDAWFAEAEANLLLHSSHKGVHGGDSDGPPSCYYGFVGTKLDRAASNRAVSTEEGLALALKYDNTGSDKPLFFETSAYTGENVREPFVALIDRIVASGLADALPPRATNTGPAAVTVSLTGGSGNGAQSYNPGCAC